MEPKKDDSLREDFGSFGTLGIELVLSVLLAGGVGYWLDGRLGTFPWLSVIGIILGTVAGLRSAYRAIMKLSEKDKPRGD